jgi:acyl carrier protein
MPAPLEDNALEFVLATIRALTVDVDVDQVSAGTVLRTLGVRSIVLINAIAEIQEHFGLENRLLEHILGGTVPLDLHTIGDLASLVVATSAPP